MNSISIDYKPTDKQRLFHSTDADEVLFGGAAGGGKTLGVVMDAFLRCLKYPETQACIFRRTYTELEDTVIKEARMRYPQSLAKYNTGRHEMALINGSKVLFRHCASPQDRYNYRGMEIQFLYFDELTSFEQEVYTFINTRKRAKRSMGLKPLVRSTSNPGGPGHGWVKALFVDAAPYMQKFTREIHSEQLGTTSLHTMQYIPSLAMENPYITDDYIRELENKPDAIRDALLYGNWNAFEGMAFPEFQPDVDKRDPNGRETRRWTHVIKPFDIHHTWPRYMSFDHGYSRPFSVGWWAIAPDGTAYRYREWYGCKPRQPNVGIELSPRQIAEGIVAREEEETRDNITVDRIADPAIFDRSRGDSVAQQMEPAGGRPGVYFRKGDNTRLAGKQQLHERLRFDADGRALLYVFENCRDFIRTIPALPYDDKHVEDIDTDAEDHCVTGDTIILTGKGPVPISQLVGTEGELISHDKRFHRYSDCRMTQQSVDIIRIETDIGSVLMATPNHRVMMWDGKWICMDALWVGCRLRGKQRVKSIANAGKADVYNLEVEETHNYLANGIVAHNCYDESRYFFMARPAPPRVLPRRERKPYDPYRRN